MFTLIRIKTKQTLVTISVQLLKECDRSSKPWTEFTVLLSVNQPFIESSNNILVGFCSETRVHILQSINFYTRQKPQIRLQLTLFSSQCVTDFWKYIQAHFKINSYMIHMKNEMKTQMVANSADSIHICHQKSH